MKKTFYIKIEAPDDFYDERKNLGNDISKADKIYFLGTIQSFLKERYELPFTVSEVPPLADKKIVLPTEEEIEKWVKEHGYCGHYTQELHEGLEEGAKWAIDFIRKNNKL